MSQRRYSAAFFRARLPARLDSRRPRSSAAAFMRALIVSRSGKRPALTASCCSRPSSPGPYPNAKLRTPWNGLFEDKRAPMHPQAHDPVCCLSLPHNHFFAQIGNLVETQQAMFQLSWKSSCQHCHACCVTGTLGLTAGPSSCCCLESSQKDLPWPSGASTHELNVCAGSPKLPSHARR